MPSTTLTASPRTTRPDPRPRRASRPAALVAALVGLLLVVGIALASHHDDVLRVTVLDAPHASIDFLAPATATDGTRTTLQGRVEVASSTGERLGGRGRLIVDRADPSRNRLTIDLDDDRSRPLGETGPVVRAPEIVARWEGGDLHVALIGSVDREQVDAWAPSDLQAIVGPDGEAVALHASPGSASLAVEVDLSSPEPPQLVTEAVSLGGVQLGELDVADVTVAVAGRSDGERELLIDLEGVVGVAGEVQIAGGRASGAVPVGGGTGQLDLVGEVGVDGGSVLAALEVPIALDDDILVLRPGASIAAELLPAVEVAATVDLGPDVASSGQLGWTDAQLAVGDVDMSVRADVSSGADGVRAALAVDDVVVLTEDVEVREAVVRVDGSTLAIDGQLHVRSATSGHDLTTAVGGELVVASDGNVSYDLVGHADDASLHLVGDELRLGGGLRLRGVIGAPVHVDGDLSLASSTAPASVVLDGASGALQFQLIADDDVAVALGTDALRLGGGLRIDGVVGAEASLRADVVALGTTATVEGRIAASDAGVRLELAAVDGTGRVSAALEIGSDEVRGTLRLGSATFGEVEVEQAQLAVTVREGGLVAELGGSVRWGEALVGVGGTVTVAADGSVRLEVDARSVVPVAPGLAVLDAHFESDGAEVLASGRLRVLGATDDDAVPVAGSLVLGAAPSFELRTGPEGDVVIDEESTLVLAGGATFRRAASGAVEITGSAQLFGEGTSITGSLVIADGLVALELSAIDDEPSDLTISLGYDLDTQTISGTARARRLPIGDLVIRHGEVDLRFGPEGNVVRVRGATTLSPELDVELEAEVSSAHGRIALRFRGLAVFADRFLDVGVAGAISITPERTDYDLSTDAATSLDVFGHGDLHLDGGLRLHGRLGEAVGVEGRAGFLDNDIDLAGTLQLDDGRVVLHLEHTDASTTTALVRIDLGADPAHARVELGEARLGVLAVSDLTADLQAGADGLVVGLAGKAQLADPSGALGGITDARAAVQDTYRRSAAGADDLQLRATVGELRARGAGVGDVIDQLDLDLADLEVDLTRAAEGEPTVGRARARLYARTNADGSLTPVRVGDARGDRVAAIALEGTIRLTAEGTIEAWELAATAGRLRIGDLTIDARLAASGDGELGARLAVSGEVRAGGTHLTGTVEGVVGFVDDRLVADLQGSLLIDDPSGLDASIHFRTADDLTLRFTGRLRHGDLVGEASGRLGFVVRPGGSIWPRIDARAAALHRVVGPDGRLEFDLSKASTQVFVDVRLSNWDHLDRLRLDATAMGAAGLEFVVPIVVDIPAALSGSARLRASGYLQLVNGQPGFDLSILAGGSGGVRVLGAFWLGAGGSGAIRARGTYEHIALDARGLAMIGMGAGPAGLSVGSGRIDLSMRIDLDEERVHQVVGSASAGIEIFGPLVKANGALKLGGSIDMERGKARLLVDARGSASALLFVAKGTGSGWLDLSIDFATPDADPVITGKARVDLSAHVLWWQLAGFHVDLRLLGDEVWVVGGERHIDGDGVLFAKRKVVGLHGRLSPNEALCGNEYVLEPVWQAAWNWVWSFGTYRYEWRKAGLYGNCSEGMRASGRVMVDADGSGGPSALDHGLGGVPVELRRPDGTLVQTATTAANGTWTFQKLPRQQHYRVFVRVPGDRPVLADPLSTTSTGGAFQITWGGPVEVPTVLLGTVPPPAPDPSDPTGPPVTTGPHRVEGTVRLDEGGDGSVDGDRAMADVQVRISGPVAATVRTGADGTWSFDGLPAGTYVVEVIRPGYEVSTPTEDGGARVEVGGEEPVVVAPIGLRYLGLPSLPGEVPAPFAPAPTAGFTSGGGS